MRKIHEHEWQHYAALRTEATVALAERILELTQERLLGPTETQVLLSTVKGGVAGLDKLVGCMRYQNVDSCSVQMIEALCSTWWQSIDVLQRYALLIPANLGTSHLRLVSSR